MAYAQIENTILWKIGLLPKAQRLTFIQLKIHSDYTTHITQPFSYKELVKKTGLDLRSVKVGIRELEKGGWLTRTVTKGYFYTWELTALKPIGQAGGKNKTESQTQAATRQPDDTPATRESPATPTNLLEIKEMDGQEVKVYSRAGRLYRFNTGSQEFETTMEWKENWETVNGHIEYLTDGVKEELRNSPYVVNPANLKRLKNLISESRLP
ncbi:MAG: helix-turn-helix domain-containing protein [Candidatus Poribacteria bacterium]|nr:helix-turn-helix domain-containing protein [Candidatus Poribacteria bacterium]